MKAWTHRIDVGEVHLYTYFNKACTHAKHTAGCMRCLLNTPPIHTARAAPAHNARLQEASQCHYTAVLLHASEQ